MRRFTLSLISALVSLVLAANAQRPSPKETRKVATPSNQTGRDYTQEAFVIEQYHSRYRFQNDGTGRKETIARIRVQSEAGVQQWGQIQIGYSSANERVEMVYVRVLKEDGTIVNATKDAMQDLSAPLEQQAPVYTDYHQMHITVPGLRPGEILEYDVATVIHTALAPGEFWADYIFDKNNIDLDEEVDFDLPADRQVKLKNKPGIDPKVTESNGRRLYHWASSHVEREDDGKEKDPAKRKELDRKKRKEQFDSEHPDIQLSSFASWEKVGLWYASIEKERRIPSPEVRAKAAELTKGLTTDLDKVEALYDFVALNFRYVSLSLGLGRYQPHAAGEVLHNQYGDCKDKNNLLASLLEAENFHSFSALMNSARKLDPDVPSPGQFDHVITLLPLGGQEVWMDTTSEVAPFRLLAYTLRKKQALVVSSAPHLEETPSDTPIPDSEVAEVEGKITQIGKFEGHVHYTFRGDEELMLRSVFRRVPEAQWQKVVENVNGAIGGDITNLKISDPAATREPFTLTYDVSRAGFLDWSKKKSDLLLPLCQFNLPDVNPEDADERSADHDPDSESFKLGPKAEYVYKIKLQIPDRYSAHSPLPLTLKRDYAAYDATYKLDGSTFIAARTLTMNQDELATPRARDYHAFREAVESDLSQFLSLENTVSGAPTPPPDMKANDLIESARTAMNNGNFPMAVQLLKRAAQDEPKNSYVWNTLGSAYISMRENGEAVAAFKKQIEINPYDDYAYRSMGQAYAQDRQYPEAEAAFKKQIEINPLDKFAHAGLGAMYSEWHKYDLAAPELEKAAQLIPDNAELQVALGDAYLNLGQDDKALATFDHAVEMAGTPLIFNNIAYQLSLKNAHLDRAQQYAESAVSATAAALRNLSLDRVTPQVLPLTPSLVAYWDTLGWVYFSEGNLDKAEKYVNAAWILGQHGEVGDHLGQIYEKEGKKDRALETYELSLTGLRPAPETQSRINALEKSIQKPATKNKETVSLPSERTIDLGKAKETGSADFFILLSGGAGAPTKVEAVRFVSGDEKLKVFGEALKTAEYQVSFPDDTPLKILRRGTVTCSTAGKCLFVLFLPDDVRTVD